MQNKENKDNCCLVIYVIKMIKDRGLICHKMKLIYGKIIIEAIVVMITITVIAIVVFN